MSLHDVGEDLGINAEEHLENAKMHRRLAARGETEPPANH
jgi:hypothetical protein